MFADGITELGYLDVLVDNAGIQKLSATAAMDQSDAYDEILPEAVESVRHRKVRDAPGRPAPCHGL